MTPDRIFYPLAALVAAALITLAMIYPQGEGARSPGTFGHTPTQQTAAAIALAQHNAKVDTETKRAAEAMRARQEHDADSSLVRTAPLK
jgi:hypothetical protein